MSMTDDIALEPSEKATKLRMVDCDIHPALKHKKALHPYLEQRWRQHLDEFGALAHCVYATRGGPYPRFTPETARRDAWPPNGNPPGSDLEFMQTQHLDAHGIEYGILQPIVGANNARNTGLSAALCTATNRWQVDEFTSRDPRLKASIHIGAEDAELAVAEIERWAGDRNFAQIQLGSRSVEPIGRKRYWPIFEAAVRNDMPIGFHVGGPSPYAPSPSGWPDYYLEDHHVLTHSAHAQVSSMILEGVFELFPRLRVVMIEAGFAWVPSLGWRLDNHWRKLRTETPLCKRPPSEYLRQNLWFTTQPADEPERREDLRFLFEQIGFDRMMFATDYPHWDFDDPERALVMPMSKDERQMLFRGNAMEFYANLD
ncbi:amidohydrolase family protein [Shinella sp.]|uniref:amidohydrolase family protein n=1 Tax=Shinella sp. TaxID=1870904 RepID=UPI0029B0C830|nr:amidohydrolase family protein [Shinella sp.]MDX3972571.1 amidohydrolase family protein [Shinella sp.]